MKRVMTILAILLLPLSVWAMTPVSDSDLSNVTGQAGVDIAPNLTMDISIGTSAWGDVTGVDTMMATMLGWNTADFGAGWFVTTNDVTTNLQLRSREAGDGYGTYVNPLDTTDVHSFSTAEIKPLTIDIASGTSHGGATFVRIGLGSLHISQDSQSKTIGFAPGDALDDTLPDMTNFQALGVQSTGAQDIYINPTSYVDIYTASGMGVNLAVNVIIDHQEMDYSSWGDTDGYTGGNIMVGSTSVLGDIGAGFVGTINQVTGPVSYNGVIRIDVGTATTGLVSEIVNGGNPVTFVRIGFDTDFVISTEGPITSQVVLGDTADLGFATGTAMELLRSFQSGNTTTIYGGSYITINAH